MNSEKQKEKARRGAIGENNVASILMQHGWDTFNANASIKNYKSIDLICTKAPDQSSQKPWKPEVTFIQVKTCVQSNIPIGFSIEQCISKSYLEKNVVGPYVFVYVDQSDDVMKFRYFILSRRQFIDLAYEAHQFYMNGYHRNDPRPSEKSPAGLYVRWLEGKSEDENAKHDAFHNPLNGISSENKWENIWIED